MSRSGYSDDYGGDWEWVMWRGAVASSLRGRRGQAFLREMLEAMDALPEKKLIAKELEAEGAVCAIGTVGRKRGLDMSGIDPEDWSTVAARFGVAEPLVREVTYINDESAVRNETPEQRFQRVRAWVANQIRD